MGEPLVFRPRPEARRANWGMVGFFLFFILLGWSLPLFGGERGRGFFLFMAGLCTLCFGGFLGMVVAALRETRRPVVLDDAGIEANGRRLAWGEVAGVEERSRPEPLVLVRPRSGPPLRLRTTAYVDGPELARLVLARAPTLADVPLDETRTYRPQGWGITAFALSVLFVMVLGLGLFNLHVPKPPRALLHPAVLQLGLMLPLVVGLAAGQLTRYVRLGPRELTEGSVFGRRTLSLALVHAVEATDTGLTVRAGERKVSLTKGYAEFPELRDRLLALTPGGTPVLDAPVAVPAREARVFAPRPYAWLSNGLMGLFCLGLGVTCVVTLVVPGFARSPGAAAALLVIAVVPSLLGAFGMWAALEARTRIVLDEEGIERQAVFGSRRFAWGEVDRAWRDGATLEGYALRSGSKAVDIPKEFLQDMPVLCATLDGRLADARGRAIRSAEGETFGPDLGTRLFLVGFLGLMGLGMSLAGVLCFTGGLMTVRPGEEGAAYAVGFLILACGLFMVVGAASVGVKRYVPMAEGLEVRTLRGRRLLRWGEVERAEAGVLEAGKREHRRATLVLEHPGGSVRIDGMTTREFDRLRGYVLSRVDPAVVRG